MKLSDFFAALFRWPRRKPQPEPDPDPVLPAESRRVEYGNDPMQYVTLDLPARRKSERVRVFLIVHGGGWWQGDADAPNVVDAKVAWLNPQGIALGSISYRLGTKSTPRIGPDMEADDVAAAVAYLRAHADELGIDADRIVLAGHSAGGHLSALGITRLGVTVAGFVGLDSACYNVVQAMEGPHPEDPFGIAFGDDPAFWEECCPTANMTKTPPPMLLAASTQRGPANIPQAEAFARKAIGFDGRAEVYQAALEHGEVNSLLGTTDTPEAAALTAKVQAFVDSVIG